MIPSLLQIPSAVSDSKLHSVLPNNGKGDFTFDRSTGATRINKDGLIEEVGYFSSELVQNGNFSELGSEALINGDFATDSDWSKGTGWVIMNGYAESDGTNAPLDQVSRLTIGKTYKVVITVTNMTSSALSVRLGTSSSNAILSISENGTYTAYGVAGATTFRLRSQGFDGRIQNVSVKQVDPNSEWTLGTGYSFAEDGVKFTNLGGTTLLQNPVWYLNKTYKVTVNLSYTSGTRIILPYDGNNTSNSISVNTAGTNVTYSYTITPLANTPNLYIYGDGNATGTIHSVSVKEVLGDRPRLSYDITNGVVEDKPHLLLEPSSTNLVTFSEDLSQSFYSKSNLSVSADNLKAPDGSLSAYKIVESTASAKHQLYASIGSYTTMSISFFAKKAERSFITIEKSGWGSTVFNIDSGSVASGTGSIQDFGNGWFRCIASYVASPAQSQFYIIINKDASTVNYEGDGISGLYLWGLQAEALTYATSYIPTAGTTITRAAETCDNSKPSVNSTEGVLYAEMYWFETATNIYLALTDGTNNNRVLIYSTSTSQISSLISSGGATQASFTISGQDARAYNKIAVKYKVNDFSIYVNGQLLGTDTNGIAPVGMNDVGFIFYGKVKGLAVYNEALTDAQLIELTS